MKAKKNISIEEQLRIAAAGAKSEGGSSFVNTIRSNGTEPISTATSPAPVIAHNTEKVASPQPPQPQQTEAYTKPSIVPYAEAQVSTPVYNKPPIQQQQQQEKQAATSPELPQESFTKHATPISRQVDQEPIVKTTLVQPVFTPSTPEHIQLNTSFVPQPIQHQNISFEVNNPHSISMIIELTDIYRGLDHQVQEVIKRFVRVEKELTSQDPKHLSNILIGVLNVKEREKTALKDLISLKLEERTSRAFSMVSLTEDRLLAVQELVLLFNTQYIPHHKLQSDNKILFCRELENGVDTLSHSTLELLKPIDRLFSVIH